jgi:ribose/xylose/arabinose/galactoside ABC-type transport system permease subunit
MRATIVVVAALTALVVTLATMLAWLNDTYRKLVQTPRPQLRSPWLRSVGGDADGAREQDADITLVERIVMVCVYVVVALFVAWFLFLARSPLPR